MKYEEPKMIISDMDDVAIICTSLGTEIGGNGPEIDLEGL